MAQVQQHRRAIAAALFGLVALAFAPALAQDQGPKLATDLYDRPVLAIDPGMHTAAIRAQAVDAEGRYAVTGGDDRTVRILVYRRRQAVAHDLDTGRARERWTGLCSGDQPGRIDDRGRRLDGANSRRLLPDLPLRPRNPEISFGAFTTICQTSRVP